MLDQLQAVTFRGHMNSIFRIHSPGMPEVDAELVEVTEKETAEAGQPRAAVRQERFSLLFRGPSERLLGQGTYQMQHVQLGTFDLFLVPVGQDQQGVYYEAIFNRLRPQDG